MKRLSSYINKKVCHGYDDRNKMLIIKEDDVSSKIKKISISNAKDEIFAFKLDCKKTGCISNYITKEKSIEGIRSGCDCIIIVEKATWKGVIFIELKSNTIDKKDLFNKYVSSKAFISYIKELHNEFKKDSFKIDNILFILFSTKPIAGSNPSRPILLPLSNYITARQYYVSAKTGEGNFNLDKLISQR